MDKIRDNYISDGKIYMTYLNGVPRIPHYLKQFQ